MSEKPNMMTKGKDQPTEVVQAGYTTNQGFELVQRIAGMFSQSTLVPEEYRGNKANCIIALEMAQRIGSSPLMTMQNMYIVHGRPAWSSQFLISCLNASKRFSPLRYKETGEKGTDSFGIIAWAKDLADGEVLEGPEVTITMAKAEGWFQKKGSKWQTMPALMCRYRAATFFARLYAPELTMGIRTTEEAADVALEGATVGPAPYASGPCYSEPDIPESEEPAIPEDDEAKEEQKQEEATQELTPVENMDKHGLKALIKTHEKEAYFDHVMKSNMLGDDPSWEKYPVGSLRDIANDLRSAAENQA